MSKRKSYSPELTRKEFIKLSAGAAAGAALGGIPGLADHHEAGELIHRPIHTTGEMIPIVGLGTAQTFGSPQDQAEFDQRKEVLRTHLAGGGINGSL